MGAGPDRDNGFTCGPSRARISAGNGNGRDLVIATHGLAMTLWLGAAIGLADPVRFWDDLLSPDLIRKCLRARTTERITLPG
jgi:hypothetical protein